MTVDSFPWGHSWGSGLGFETLRVNTEPFHAFFTALETSELKVWRTSG